ncbi:hypothetical protein AAIP36_000049 [Flavobacterium psychrophilum]
MQINNSSLFLYLFASIFASIGIFIGNELMILLMKPMIIPAILFYYIQIRTEKVNWLFLIILLSNFISDMLVLFELPEGNFPIALLNMFGYLMFIYLSVKDISLKNLSNLNFLYFALIVMGCVLILHVVLDLMPGIDSFTNNLYTIYGILLSILASIIGFNYLNQENEKTFYALLMGICFITSDVFFVIYNFYLNLVIFMFLNVTIQFISYYYMVKYITSNSKKEILLQNEK